MIDLAGRGALIVGTRRVGATVVQRLAAEGVALAIGYRSSRDEAEAQARAVIAKGGRALTVPIDTAQEASVAEAVRGAGAALGGLAFVINLASGFERAPLEALDGAAWDRAMADAKGAYLLTLHATRLLQANSGSTRGHIIHTTDWAAGATPYRHYLPYLTSKAAVNFMVRAFAVELAPHRILVNAIAPGPTMRPPDYNETAWQERIVGQTPLRRESSPDDIAELIITLLKSETITGETIRVDAGRHLAGPMEG